MAVLAGLELVVVLLVLVGNEGLGHPAREKELVNREHLAGRSRCSILQQQAN